jgi:arabinose-5-phosphate isomerase
MFAKKIHDEPDLQSIDLRQMTWDSKTVLEKGRECIRVEAEALEATRLQLGESFVELVMAIEATVDLKNKVIFSGVGKSAHICQKLVGTFNSIGVPAIFLDPTQALHGDLGLCAAGDLAFLISNSGHTEELVRLVPLLKRFALKTAIITGMPDSALTKICDHTLLFHVPREACPLQLAPTASTTASMAIGDALAMVYLEKRGFTRNDFARFHPAGALGLSLLLRVSDIMRTGERFPCLPQSRPVKDAILAMTQARGGCLALIDESTSRLTGVFTDGDFRRSALIGPDFLDRPVHHFMTRQPKTISPESLAVEALRIFETHKIDDLVVVDSDGIPVGIVDNQDLPRLKIL